MNIKQAGGYNTPLRGEKGSLYEGGIKSVGIINSPLLPKAKTGTVQTSMMHVTDWLPTLLEFGGCPGLNYGGKPLDGISLAPVILSEAPESNTYQPREEILHFMNPLATSDRTDSRVTEWENGPLKGKCFPPSTRAVLRWKKWKLFTGLFIIQLFYIE